MLGNLCVALDEKTKVRCTNFRSKMGQQFLCRRHGAGVNVIMKSAFVTRDGGYQIIVDGLGKVGFRDKYGTYHNCVKDVFDRSIEVGQEKSDDDELEIRIAYLEL